MMFNQPRAIPKTDVAAEKAYQARKNDLMEKVRSEPDSARRAHMRRQANCREILEPLTHKDETERLKRQKSVQDMLATGRKNAKYASENADRLAAEAAQRRADKAQADADKAREAVPKAAAPAPKGGGLRAVSGIGPATVIRLVNYGVDTLEKLAALDNAGQARCKQAIANPKADMADWVDQAKELISE